MSTQLYTPTGYASLMRVTPQYVRRCCADGTVKAFRMSIGQGKRRTWRIPFDEESIGDMAAQNAAACASAAAGAEMQQEGKEKTWQKTRIRRPSARISACVRS